MKTFPFVQAILLATVLCAEVALAADVRFIATMRLLNEKADACIRSGRQSSLHCKDFSDFDRYIFKRDAWIWVQQEMDAGNITDANLADVTAMMEKNAKAHAVP